MTQNQIVGAYFMEFSHCCRPEENDDYKGEEELDGDEKRGITYQVIKQNTIVQ